MTLLQALAYFAREAVVNLVRSWKVSLLAVLTIAVSLCLGGTFLLASRNLGGAVERWRAEARVVVYLQPQTAAPELARLADEARRAPFVAAVEPVSPALARRRFAEAFPSLGNLALGLGQEPLPASLEIALAAPGARARRPPGRAELAAWIAAWRRRPEVSLVDDDREWLAQLETFLAIVRGVGLALGAVLLAAAVFTIASVIRLTAYLHHEEIATMRLVGATEFYIRGPFYVEGLLQGLLGAAVALAALLAAFRAAHARAGASIFASLLATDFLSPRQLAWLVLVGASAGLLGAVASLRREAL